MSDVNPFEAPIEASGSGAYGPGPVKIPTSLMVISIIGLIFGLFGLLGVCFGGVGLAMSQSIVEMVPDEEAKVAMREMMDLQFIPTVIQLALSLFVAPLLIAASIGCLTRKSWSEGLMKIALMGSILSSVVGLGLTAWLLLFHWDAINAPNAAQPGGEAITIVSQVIGVGMALAFLGFYIWGLIAMGGKTIKSFYDQINGTGR